VGYGGGCVDWAEVKDAAIFPLKNPHQVEHQVPVEPGSLEDCQLTRKAVGAAVTSCIPENDEK